MFSSCVPSPALARLAPLASRLLIVLVVALACLALVFFGLAPVRAEGIIPTPTPYGTRPPGGIIPTPTPYATRSSWSSTGGVSMPWPVVSELTFTDTSGFDSPTTYQTDSTCNYNGNDTPVGVADCQPVLSIGRYRIDFERSHPAADDGLLDGPHEGQYGDFHLRTLLWSSPVLFSGAVTFTFEYCNSAGLAAHSQTWSGLYDWIFPTGYTTGVYYETSTCKRYWVHANQPPVGSYNQLKGVQLKIELGDTIPGSGGSASFWVEGFALECGLDVFALNNLSYTDDVRGDRTYFVYAGVPTSTASDAFTSTLLTGTYHFLHEATDIIPIWSYFQPDLSVIIAPAGYYSVSAVALQNAAFQVCDYRDSSSFTSLFITGTVFPTPTVVISGFPVFTPTVPISWTESDGPCLQLGPVQTVGGPVDAILHIDWPGVAFCLRYYTLTQLKLASIDLLPMAFLILDAAGVFLAINAVRRR